MSQNNFDPVIMSIFIGLLLFWAGFIWAVKYLF
jgi:hypothetical protein